MTKKFRFGALFLAMIILCTTFVLPTASANVNVGNVTINKLFDRVIISGTANPNSYVETKILDEYNNLVAGEDVSTDDSGNFTFYRHASEFTNGSEKYSVEIDGENFGEFTPPEDMPGSANFAAIYDMLEIEITCPITEDLLIEVKKNKSETIFSYEYKLSEHEEDIEFGKYYHEHVSVYDTFSTEYTLYFNGLEWDTVLFEPITEPEPETVHNLSISRSGGSILFSGKTDSSNARVYLELAADSGTSYFIDTYSENSSFSESLSLPDDKYYVKNYYGEELGFFILKNRDEIQPIVTSLSGKFENGFWIISGEADSEGYIYLTLKNNCYFYNCKFRAALNEETGKAQFERKIYVGSMDAGNCSLTANGSSYEFYNDSYSASDYLIITPDAEKISISGELPQAQPSEKAELKLVNSDGNVLYSSSVSSTDTINDCIYLNDIDMPAGDYYIMIDGAEYKHFKVPELCELLFANIVSDYSTGEVIICGTTEPNSLIKTHVTVDTFPSDIPYTTISDAEGNFELIIPNQQKSGEMCIYVNSDITSGDFLTINYVGVQQLQLILDEINNCDSAESMKSTIEKWADIINVNIDKINSLRNPIRIYEIMLGNRFSSIENVARYIDEQVLLESIAECSSLAECEYIVRQNIDLIGIDSARLNRLTYSSKMKVYRSITEKRFNDIRDLRNALENAIMNELSSGSSGSSSGSSGSGGGGSSGGNNTPGMLIGYVKSSLPSGCYFAGENVIKLSYSSENADIYYTIDGSEPTAESIKYTGEIPLTEDIAIKAIAVVDGAKTAVKTFSYTVAERIDGIKVMQVLGNSAVLSIGALKDADSIIFHSTSPDETWDVSASFNEDMSMATVYGLQPKSTVYIIIDANYPDGTKTTRTEYFCTGDEISSDCELEYFGEFDAIIDRDEMTVTNIKLPNKYEKKAFYAEVSNGAEYAFYPSKYSNTPYAENIVPLKEGKNVFYIKITASDKVTKKVYKITAYRNTKSDKPQIEIKDGKAYITAAEGARIFYTTDNSPVNMMLAAEYSEGFEVCPGMIIRAIASETGKDEVSDETILSVENNDYKAIIDIIDCSDNAKYADYELNIVSTEKTDALLICAEYKGGRLAGLEMMPMSLLAGDNAVSKRFTRTAENSEFKLMLWASAESMKPLALPQR